MIPRTTSVRHRPLPFLSCVIFFLFALSSSVQAQTTLLTHRSDLTSPDTFHWNTVGSEGDLLNTFSVTSAGGVTATVSKPADEFLRVDQDSLWNGNFASGDPLVWTLTASGPLTLDFGAHGFLIEGIGTQIQPNTYGDFTAAIEAYDINNFLLGSYSVNGNSTDQNDDTALFLGLKSDSANIAKVVFSVPFVSDPSGETNNFALNRIDFTTAAVVPEPSSLALLLPGLAAIWLFNWRKGRIRSVAPRQIQSVALKRSARGARWHCSLLLHLPCNLFTLCFLAGSFLPGARAVASSADLRLLNTSATSLFIPGIFVSTKNMQYSTNIVNFGPDEATGIVWTDKLPDEVEVVLVSTSFGDGCSVSNNVVTCNIPKLNKPGAIPPPGELGSSASVVIIVTPKYTGIDHNEMEVKASTLDPVSSNNKEVQDTFIEASADLGITGTASVNPATVLEPLTDTYTVTNHGPDPATGVVFTSQLPLHTELVSRSASQGACSDRLDEVVQVFTIVTCVLGDLPKDGSATVEIVLKPTQSGTLFNGNNYVDGNEWDFSTNGNNVVDVTVEVKDTPPPPPPEPPCLFGSEPKDDEDKDGLLDCWEEMGIAHKGPENTRVVDLDLPAMGANPKHKDIFVEIDYMSVSSGANAHTHDPRLLPDGSQPGTFTSALQRVVQAFDAAPVDNPDNIKGINLHLLVDEEIKEVTPLRFDANGATPAGVTPAGTFDDLKTQHFGTVDERASAEKGKILEARKQAFHYCLFGHNHAHLIGSTGIAELEGNDLMVTIRVKEPTATNNWEESVKSASTAFSTTFDSEWIDLVAGTFMHELGHNLGLDHGGGKGIPAASSANRKIDKKPNYLSVMSYARQQNGAGRAFGLPGITDGEIVRLNRKLDYSREALPTLEESELDESVGIQGGAGERTLYGVNGEMRVGPSQGSINWDGDESAAEQKIEIISPNDINWIITNPAQPPPASPGETLIGHNDWANLIFDFKLSTGFADGNHLSAFEVEPEGTQTDYLNLTLGTPDYDGDGIYNHLDNCVLIANSEQADLEGDGRGDVCDEDMDGDGVLFLSDCDDRDRAVHPGAVEVKSNGKDDDCNPSTLDRYTVELLYNPALAVQIGKTLLFKLRIRGDNNANLSSKNLLVTALHLSKGGVMLNLASTTTGNTFLFSSNLDGSPGYLFSLSTKNLSAGSYVLDFKVAGDSGIYTLPFKAVP